MIGDILHMPNHPAVSSVSESRCQRMFGSLWAVGR